MKKFILSLLIMATAATTAAAGKIKSIAEGPFASTVYTLSNGMKVYLRPGSADNTQVEITAYAPVGFATNYNPHRQATYHTAADLLAVSRIGNQSGADLRRANKAMGVSSKMDIDNYASEISITAPSEKLDYALGLVKTYSQDITPDTAAMRRWADGKRRVLLSPKRSAVVAMGDSIHSRVYRNHPLGAKLSIEDIDNLDYNDVLKLHKELFGNMADFTVIITGVDDTPATRQLISNTLANLPVGRKHKKPTNVHYGYHQGGKTLSSTYPAAHTPQTIIYTFRSADATFSLENVLLSRTLGTIYRNRIASALNDVVSKGRDITSHCAVVDNINGTYSGGFMILPCYIKAPHGYESTVCAAVDGEINALATVGPTAGEVEAQRRILLSQYKSLKEDIGYWQTIIRKYLTTGVDLDSDYEQTVKNLTPQQLRDFAATYVLTSSPLRMTMSPQ